MQTSFKKYHLSTQLSKKTLRDVYTAYPVDESEHEIVLKVFDTTCLPSDYNYEDFVEKAELIKHLNHQYLVPVLDIGIEEGEPYVVSEYVPYGSLRSRMDSVFSEHLDTSETLNICLQLGQALSYIHQFNIIHGNIKPENILFDADGNALLTDFGLVGLIDVNNLDYKSDISAASYMPPEQFVGNLSEKSDQYSLACIIYELLTGRVPFTAQNFSLMWLKYSTDVPVAPSEIDPSLPKSIDAALLKALAHDPSNRHHDIATFIESFRLVSLPKTSQTPLFPFAHIASSTNKREVSSFTSDEAGPMDYLGTPLLKSPIAELSVIASITEEDPYMVGIVREEEEEEDPYMVGIVREEEEEEDPYMVGIVREEEEDEEDPYMVGIVREEEEEEDPYVVGVVREEEEEEDPYMVGIVREEEEEDPYVVGIVREEEEEDPYVVGIVREEEEEDPYVVGIVREEEEEEDPYMVESVKEEEDEEDPYVVGIVREEEEEEDPYMVESVKEEDHHMAELVRNNNEVHMIESMENGEKKYITRLIGEEEEDKKPYMAGLIGEEEEEEEDPYMAGLIGEEEEEEEDPYMAGLIGEEEEEEEDPYMAGLIGEEEEEEEDPYMAGLIGEEEEEEEEKDPYMAGLIGEEETEDHFLDAFDEDTSVEADDFSSPSGILFPFRPGNHAPHRGGLFEDPKDRLAGVIAMDDEAEDQFADAFDEDTSIEADDFISSSGSSFPFASGSSSPRRAALFNSRSRQKVLQYQSAQLDDEEEDGAVDVADPLLPLNQVPLHGEKILLPDVDDLPIPVPTPLPRQSRSKKGPLLLLVVVLIFTVGIVYTHFNMGFTPSAHVTPVSQHELIPTALPTLSASPSDVATTSVITPVPTSADQPSPTEIATSTPVPTEIATPTPVSTEIATPTPQDTPTAAVIPTLVPIPVVTPPPPLPPPPPPIPTPTPTPTPQTSLTCPYQEFNQYTNLTSEGTVDWVQWGLNTATDVNHKAAITSQISNVIFLGNGHVGSDHTHAINFTWSDGNPSKSVKKSTGAIYLSGLNNGFSITVPAKSQLQTLKLYVGANLARGLFFASLNGITCKDASLDMTHDPTKNVDNAVYTITYSTNMPDQKLTINYTEMASNGNAGYVLLEAATLQ